MLTIKCGREEIQLNGKDEIMYNGSCYQVTSRKIRDGWNESSPILAKSKAERLIKNGQLILDRKSKIRDVDIEIYKINITSDISE